MLGGVSRRICGGNGYIRTSAEPQVRPPPSASSSTRSPRLMRPSRHASASASGTEAADVLACRSTVTTTRSCASPSLRAHRVDDALVGLMRHQPVDIAPGQAVGGQRFVHRLGEPGDRVTEHLAPVHHQMAGLVALTDRAIDIQDVAQRALGVQMGGLRMP